MDRHPDPPVQRGEDLHQPVQRKPPETRIANAREVHRRETRRLFGLPYRQDALVQHRDDSRRDDRLGLLQVGIGLSDVPKDVAAPLNQLELALAHHSSFFLSRLNRERTKKLRCGEASGPCGREGRRRYRSR